MSPQPNLPRIRLEFTLALTSVKFNFPLGAGSRPTLGKSVSSAGDGLGATEAFYPQCHPMAIWAANLRGSSPIRTACAGRAGAGRQVANAGRTSGAAERTTNFGRDGFA